MDSDRRPIATIKLVNNAEEQRLTFLFQTRNIGRAIEFAEQTFMIYRRAAKLHKKDAIKRLGFLRSCLSFREFLRKNREY